MDELDAVNFGGTALSILGMTCSGCANTVTRVLSRVPGVASANVDFENGHALVTGTAHPEDLVKAVEAAGYGAQITQEKSTGVCSEHGRSRCC